MAPIQAPAGAANGNAKIDSARMLKGKAIGDIVSFLKGANMYNASKLMENSGITPEEIRDAVKGRRTSPVSEKTLDYFFTYHNERCSSGFGDLFSDAKLAEPRPA